jgi:hypothetical protein
MFMAEKVEEQKRLTVKLRVTGGSRAGHLDSAAEEERLLRGQTDYHPELRAYTAEDGRSVVIIRPDNVRITMQLGKEVPKRKR